MDTSKDEVDKLQNMLQLSTLMSEDDKKDCESEEDWKKELTEEMAEEWFAKAGLLLLVKRDEDLEHFNKELKKLTRAGGYKQYDIGKRSNYDFSMTSVAENEKQFDWSYGQASVMLFNYKRPDAKYAVRVEHGLPNMPVVSLIAPASSCSLLEGKIKGTNDKVLVFNMPVEMSDGVHFNAQLRWTLNPQDFSRYMKDKRKVASQLQDFQGREAGEERARDDSRR